MGEVYRATDKRLQRQVAVKVLSKTFSSDPDALRRFEQEARAAGVLNHPNILAIFDIGTEGDQRYIVSEMLEGESLRSRLRQGPIPPRRTIDYAVQIARGLGAAHEKGIIHRDLKPENLFVTRDGQVKILDFGLVKLMGPKLPNADTVDGRAQTAPITPTEPGRLLGTVGYMSPEQIRGQSGDHRSDIFAFGIILFEMLAGRPAFRGDSPIETLNAILKEDPPDLYELNIRVPAALERTLRHCLEKSPEERFQSARDLAFDLGAMSGLTSRSVPILMPRLRWRSLRKPALVVLAAALVTLGAYIAGTYHGHRQPPDSPESRDLGFGQADVLAISSTGQIAISLRRHPIGYARETGTLAQVPIAGGTPRELLEEVEAADWSTDGRLAIVRAAGGRSRLEFPIGTVLYETTGWITSPRFNPRGDTIAFLDHPILNDDRGTLALVDIATRAHRNVTAEWTSLEGLAWAPDGKEIWFAGERLGFSRSINAVTLAGKDRLIATSAGALWLQDVARDGRVLATREYVRAGINGMRAGEAKERDLSWLDFSIVRDISSDGKTIIFSESGEAGGAIYGVYVRGTDGSPAIRLGEGTTEALSPDGQSVLSIARNRLPAQIVMLPIGAGEPRQVTRDAINHRFARFSPDGRSIFFQGDEPGHASRMWMQPLDGHSPPRAVTPENVSGRVMTTDGRQVVASGPDRKYSLYAVDGKTPPMAVSALHPGDVPTRFAADGSLYVASFGKIPALLWKVNLATGARTVVHEAMPADPSGLTNVGPILTTPDGTTAVYSYTRILSDLFLVDANAK